MRNVPYYGLAQITSSIRANVDILHQSPEQARERNGQVHLNEMVALIEPQAKCKPNPQSVQCTCKLTLSIQTLATIPQELRDDILNKLRAFVQNNVED